MKITLEPTPEIFDLSADLKARVWRGETDKGVPLVAYVAMVSPTLAPDDPRQESFVKELTEVTSTASSAISSHRQGLDPLPPRSFDARHFVDFDDDEDPYDDGEDFDTYEDIGNVEDWE